MENIKNVKRGLACRKGADKRCGNPCERSGLCWYAKQIIGLDGEPVLPFVCDKEKLIEETLTVIEELEERIAIMAESEADEQKWNFFIFREPTDEEKESYENVDLFVENCPECGEEVLVWNGKGVYQDTFLDDGDAVYFENSIHDIQPGWAWMPLPKPPKEGEQE